MENIYAKKSLGQNFLKDENVLKKIADSFDTNERDLIIEIGPGKGALTKYLVQKPGTLICYEIDDRMKDILLSFQDEKVKIIFDDFLSRNIEEDIKKDYSNIYVIANIPYYITTPIIEHLLESNITISGMTLLVQKEVAKRFTASPKSKDYGYFTVYLNHYFEMKEILEVSPNSFSPPPKVWSSVVCFKKKEMVEDIDIHKFQVFLKQAFSQKRKTLKNNLKEYDWNKVLLFLRENNKSESIRAEELSYQEFVQLYKELQETS